MQCPTKIFIAALKSASRRSQSPKVSYTDSTRLFLQKNLEAQLPPQKGVTLVEGHFSEEGMELGNARAAYASLVMPIIETRV